ncbi:MFS transporter [Acidovorax sp.]|uniref:MFS transporter n=1 Tax=Acidovorax sp. TaxID=1872122 RepID=UPI003CFF45B2
MEHQPKDGSERMTKPAPTSSPPQSRHFAVGAAVFTSLAVFSQEIVWNFYDAQVPPALRQYTHSAALIGLLMGMDNFLGLFIQPWMAHRSDRTNTRFGRRLPYLMIGAPLAAVFYVLIPWASSLPMLVAAMFCFAILANGFKAVTDALIADFQAPEHRGKANAMAKIATALTIATGSAISYFIVDKSPHLAFALPAMILVVGTGLVCWLLDERKSYASALRGSQGDDERPYREVVKDIFRSRDRRLLSMLVAVFATAGVWSASRAQLSPYAMEVVGLTRGEAGTLALPGGIAFLIAVLPIAFLSDRWNRVDVCRFGCLVFAAGCLLAFTSPTPKMTMIGLAIGSIGYAAFAVNGLVIVWNLAPQGRSIGAYTGFYTIAAACGATVMPAFIGLLIDLTGWRYMMLHVALGACVCFVLMSLVERRPPSKHAALVGSPGAPQ